MKKNICMSFQPIFLSVFFLSLFPFFTVGANPSKAKASSIQIANNVSYDSTCCTPTVSPCDHTSICAATTITTSGAYCLCQDITGVITIASNDVDLDLNNYTISGGTNGIVINTGVQRVNIHNGSITNTTSSAIIVNQGASLIILDTLTLANVTNDLTTYAFAIELAGADPVRITDCLLQNISISNAQVGIRAIDTDKTIINNCRISDCFSSANDCYGITIQASTSNPCLGNKITNCSINNCSTYGGGFSAAAIFLFTTESTLLDNNFSTSVQGDGFANIIDLRNVNNTVINNCTLMNLESSNPNPIGFDFAAIAFENGTGLIITNCKISNIATNSPLSGGDFGIIVYSGSDIIIEDTLVTNIGTPPTLPNNAANTAAGIFVTGGADATVRNCICRGIISNHSANGFILTTNNLQCVDCLAANVYAFFALGFDSIGGDSGVPSGGVNRNYAGCRATDIVSNGQSTGFRMDGGGACFIDCEADHIVCTATTNIPSGGNFAAGYAIFPTCTEVTFINCVANDMENEIAEYGFFISGNANCLQNCLAANSQYGIYVPYFGVTTNPTINNCQVSSCAVGINVLNPASMAVVTNCYAANNNINYSGVSNIATLGTPYTNPSMVGGFNLSA